MGGVVGFERRFGAELEARSWGDRLANKWNFLMPGLPEAVEIHMGRLGQTGEQFGMAARLMRRTRVVTMNAALGPLDYRVPEGMHVEPGSVVVAPLGPRQLLGVAHYDDRVIIRRDVLLRHSLNLIRLD